MFVCPLFSQCYSEEPGHPVLHHAGHRQNGDAEGYGSYTRSSAGKVHIFTHTFLEYKMLVSQIM